MTRPAPAPDRAADELWLTGALLVLGTLFVAAALQTPVDEDAELNSRALPLTMAFGVIAGSAARAVQLLRGCAREVATPSEQLRILATVVAPMSLSMVGYVVLVQALGYLAATAAAMVAVQWIFGTRRPLLILVTAGVAATAAHILFVGLLGIYMPEGWLIELMLDAIGGT